MAFTAQSQYQSASQEHNAGRPPNTDKQRASETFDAYRQRMWAQYLYPDIDPDESDADYLTRRATYLPTASYMALTVGKAITADTATSATSATTATSATSAVSASYALSASFAP